MSSKIQSSDINFDAAWDNAVSLPSCGVGIHENVSIASASYSTSDKGNLVFRITLQSDPSDNPDDSKQHFHNIIYATNKLNDPAVAKRNTNNASDLGAFFAASQIPNAKEVFSKFFSDCLVKPELFENLVELFKTSKFRIKLIYDHNADSNFAVTFGKRPFVEPADSKRLFYNPVTDDKKLRVDSKPTQETAATQQTNQAAPPMQPFNPAMPPSGFIPKY
jgi:hypothetical protein